MEVYERIDLYQKISKSEFYRRLVAVELKLANTKEEELCFKYKTATKPMIDNHQTKLN